MITQGDIIVIAKEAIYTIIVSAAPLLLISLVIGLVWLVIVRRRVHEKEEQENGKR